MSGEQNVAAIAAGLTCAQRAVLLAGSRRPKKWSVILRHAKRCGRVGRRLDFFVRDTSHSLHSFRLNDRGAAVRAHLLSDTPTQVNEGDR